MPKYVILGITALIALSIATAGVILASKEKIRAFNLDTQGIGLFVAVAGGTVAVVAGAYSLGLFLA